MSTEFAAPGPDNGGRTEVDSGRPSMPGTEMTHKERDIILERFPGATPCWRMPTGYLVFTADGDLFLLLSPGRQIEQCRGWELVEIRP